MTRRQILADRRGLPAIGAVTFQFGECSLPKCLSLGVDVDMDINGLYSINSDHLYFPAQLPHPGKSMIHSNLLEVNLDRMPSLR